MKDSDPESLANFKPELKTTVRRLRPNFETPRFRQIDSRTHTSNSKREKSYIQKIRSMKGQS